MPDWSRRRALHALATGTTVALAGCNGERSFTEESTPRRGAPITDYTMRKVRDTAGHPLFWTGDRPTRTRVGRRGRQYLTSADDSAAVTFSTESDVATEIRSFVRETDYSSQSVALHSQAVPECYDLRLLGVTRRSDGYLTSFCRTLRPADVACDADAIDTVAIAIRLPFPGDDVTSHGSHWSRGCYERPRPLTPANTTFENGGNEQ